jgi:hypothetical protein
MMKHQRIAVAIVGTAVLAMVVFCAFPFFCHNNPAVDLPEELQAITEDSANAIPLYGWRDSTGKPHVEMRNYKADKIHRHAPYEKE